LLIVTALAPAEEDHRRMHSRDAVLQESAAWLLPRGWQTAARQGRDGIAVPGYPVEYFSFF